MKKDEYEKLIDIYSRLKEYFAQDHMMKYEWPEVMTKLSIFLTEIREDLE